MTDGIERLKELSERMDGIEEIREAAISFLTNNPTDKPATIQALGQRIDAAEKIIQQLVIKVDNLTDAVSHSAKATADAARVAADIAVTAVQKAAAEAAASAIAAANSADSAKEIISK